MSATLEAPSAVQHTPRSFDDETKTLSTSLNPPACSPSSERSKIRFDLRRLAPAPVPRQQLDQLPLALTVQPFLSPFDRVARDFPDLFIIASSC